MLNDPILSKLVPSEVEGVEGVKHLAFAEINSAEEFIEKLSFPQMRGWQK